jgi:hypothetical protein
MFFRLKHLPSKGYILLGLILFGLMTTSCRPKLKPGSTQPNSPAVVNIYQPFHWSYVLSSTSTQVGVRNIVSVKTFNNQNQVVNYSGSPYVWTQSAAANRVHKYVKNLNQPQGATLIQVSVRVTNLGCSWPFPSHSYSSEKGGLGEFEWDGPILKFPATFDAWDWDFEEVYASEC